MGRTNKVVAPVAVVEVPEVTCTVIKFAALIGRPPQQVYSMIRTGSLGSELIVKMPKPDGTFQPMLKVDATLEWWNARLAKRAGGAVVQVAAGVDQVVARMQDMMAQSTDPEVMKLAAVFAKMMELSAK